MLPSEKAWNSFWLDWKKDLMVLKSGNGTDWYIATLKQIVKATQRRVMEGPHPTQHSEGVASEAHRERKH